MPHVEIGDVVRDNYGRSGIVVREEPPPDQSWVDAQSDSRVNSVDRACRWLGILPFDGGLLIAPEPLVERVRRADADDIRTVAAEANSHGIKLLVEALPNAVLELLRDRS